jgi:hypothetical protein
MSLKTNAAKRRFIDLQKRKFEHYHKSLSDRYVIYVMCTDEMPKLLMRIKPMTQCELKEHIRKLERELRCLEMSDDYCFTNGKYTALNNQIIEARKELSK